ncbi:hypothetical protein [Dactylosporangium salmoneum]|uniref:Condensation domain-containing protein n=1 Tax=Dactylosporangium salmoneum TaxID=53361 RepID=A0ABP5UB00_9ACTN
MRTVELREGGLTLSQQEWVQWIPADSPTSFEDNIWGVLPGGGVPVAQVAAAVRDVLDRHEGLRSMVDRACRLQVAEPVGERIDEVLRVGDTDPRRDEGWRRTCFRVGEQWPIQVVVHAVGGAARSVGVVVDHVAIDPWGLAVLRRELGQAIRARAAGRSPFAGAAPAQQPLDVAAEEAGPAGRAYQARAREYWQGQLDRLAAALGDRPPGVRPAAKPAAARGFRSACLLSRRAGAAASAVAERTGVPAAALFLHAFGSAVCAAEDAPAAGLFAISANRLTGAAAGSVRKATMTMPIVVPAAAPDLAAALAGCAAQQLHGHRYANADPAVTEAMCRDTLGDRYETGVAYPRFSYLTEASGNDTAPAWAAVTEAFGDAEDPVVTFGRPRDLGARYMLTVSHDRRGAILDLEWSQESGWGPHAEAMLRGMEAFVVGLST